MSRIVIYILAGLFGVFYVLPRIVWMVADWINGYIHPEGPREERVSQSVSALVTAKNALSEPATQPKTGRAPSIALATPTTTRPTTTIKGAVEHVAPPAIVGAQKSAAAVAVKSVAGPAAPTGTMPERHPSPSWVKIQLSNGRLFAIRPEKLEEAKRRDPNLKILQ